MSCSFASLDNSTVKLTVASLITVSQGIEISKVEGLETLQELRELVLDQNKIKVKSIGRLYLHQTGD